MANLIQFKRGQDASNAGIPAAGEPIWVNNNQLRIGNGSAVGGVALSGGVADDQYFEFGQDIDFSLGFDASTTGKFILKDISSDPLLMVRQNGVLDIKQQNNSILNNTTISGGAVGDTFGSLALVGGHLYLLVLEE